MKKLWQKIQTFLNRFKKPVETTSVVEATPTATNPIAFIVEPVVLSKVDVSDKVYLRVNGVVVFNNEGVVVQPPTGPTDPVPPPPPSKPPSKVDYSNYVGMTKDEIEYKVKHRYLPPLPEGWDWDEAFAAGVLRTYGQGPASDDKRNIRDLSVINGPAIVEGHAGHVDTITVKRPKGERVQIVTGRTTSALGAVSKAVISVPTVGAVSEADGLDAHTLLEFISTGEDYVFVHLKEAGALAISRY